MIGTPGEDQSASTRADTRNPSWKEGRDAAGADARGGPGSPPYERAFGTPHGVSAGAARGASGPSWSGRTKQAPPQARERRPTGRGHLCNPDTQEYRIHVSRLNK